MPTSEFPVVEVLLDHLPSRPLDYTLPEELKNLNVGMRVQAPLRGRSALGTIVSLKKKGDASKLKAVEKALSEKTYLTPDLMELAHWIAKYYAAPLGKVIKAMLPPVVRDGKDKAKRQAFVKLLLSRDNATILCKELRNKHSAQAKVLDVLLMKKGGLLLSQLLEEADTSTSPIKTLEKKRVLSIRDVMIDRSPFSDQEYFQSPHKSLTGEQETTLREIQTSFGSFQVHLIHGVTGSGKTEVYLQAIDHALKQNQGIIYLVPEIALTSQTVERFRSRFGSEKIAIIHHRLSSGERYDMWHQMAEGKIKIAIGARSAVFSPILNLGLVIVDEEHESSYKQSDESPKYHARDVAVIRAKIAHVPVLLGSATPSLESYTNARSGKYTLHTLKSRPNSALLPSVQIIDMSTEFEKAKGFTLFSHALIEGIKKRVELGEQTLLFLNRRGYHTSAECPQCSHVISCPNCDLSLTYHLGEATLACHLCDYRTHPPRECPECKKPGPIKFRGVGTELVERSLHALLPDIKTLRLDADTTKHKGSHERIFRSFRSGKADVLIGTQMIAKGLHFPLVTLVGVLGVDSSLNIPDFRASEKIFQLLTQVAGRAGRGDLKGEVLIQTHLTDHPLLHKAAAQDYEAFYEGEIEVRHLFTYPPFSHLIKLSFSGENATACLNYANTCTKVLIKLLPKNAEIHPVVPCGYARIRGKYRFQALIKGPAAWPLIQAAHTLQRTHQPPRSIRLSIEVDPQSTFF